ncbi:MAG: histidine kinase, partial [Frankiales bacterium]|nr:histidine kinase [Frankiales bacterium]
MSARRASLLERSPLRVKLVAAVLLLVTVALVSAGFIAATLMRSYLVSRNDSQLADVIARSADCALPGTTATSGGAAAVPACNRTGDGHGRGNTAHPGPTVDTDGDALSDAVGPPSPFFVQYSHADGTLYGEVRNPLAPAESPPALPTMTLDDARARAGKPFTVSSKEGDAQWRVVAAPLADADGSVMVAQSLGDVEATVRRLAAVEAIVGGLVLLAVAVIGRWLVRRSLRPLEDVEETAGAIAAGDLSRRVPHDEQSTTEVGRLASSLNGMLHQIETAFA